MWVLEYEDIVDGTRFLRNLKHGKRYQIGRESSGNESQFFIKCNINRLYISKKHLSIEVYTPDVNDIKSKSILSITFESKASTIVNNEKFKLRSNQSPFKKEFEADVNIEFKEKNEKITIRWIPFNVLKTDALSFLKDAFNWGLDLRITSLPQLANAVVVEENNISNKLAADAMIYDLPIMTIEWLKYISEKHVDLFHPDLTSKFMFRDNYANSTGQLFQGYVFQSGDFREELKNFIEKNGGTFVKTNYDLLESTLDFQSFLNEKFLHKQDKNLIFTSNPTLTIQEFAELYGTTVIQDEDIFLAIKENNVESFKPIKFHNKRPAGSEEPDIIDSQKDSVVSQSQWRRRKRVKKVDALAFLMPTQTSSPSMEDGTENVITDSPDLHLDKPAIDLIGSTEAQEDIEISNKRETGNPPLADKQEESLNPPANANRKREGDTEMQSLNKRKRFKPDEILGVEDLEFIPDIESHDQRHKQKSIQLNKETKKTSTRPELVNAISTTKDQLSESIKKELDIDTFVPQYEGQTLDSYVEERLGSLAIVETVDIKPRKQVGSSNSDKALYQGRKNFKKFRKNMPVKSFVTRTFIELQSPERQNAKERMELRKAQENSNMILDELQEQAEMKKKPDHSTEEESQGLFVKDSQDDLDSQPDGPDISITDKQNNPFLKNQDDDDDDERDDDMPRFAFTEN